MLPCNQFGWQEPGSEAEIKKFVEDKFDFKGVGVNMMSKIDVDGGKTHPVWQFLKEKHPGDVRLNFAAKFIIDSEGNVVERIEDPPARPRRRSRRSSSPSSPRERAVCSGRCVSLLREVGSLISRAVPATRRCGKRFQPGIWTPPALGGHPDLSFPL